VEMALQRDQAAGVQPGIGLHHRDD
jgi:hypothetical protein